MRGDAGEHLSAKCRARFPQNTEDHFRQSKLFPQVRRLSHAWPQVAATPPRTFATWKSAVRVRSPPRHSSWSGCCNPIRGALARRRRPRRHRTRRRCTRGAAACPRIVIDRTFPLADAAEGVRAGGADSVISYTHVLDRGGLGMVSPMEPWHKTLQARSELVRATDWYRRCSGRRSGGITLLRRRHAHRCGTGRSVGGGPNAHGFIYVLEGSVVMQVKGGEEKTLTPGQTFYEGPDGPGNAHFSTRTGRPVRHEPTSTGGSSNARAMRT
jgi:hypothetical protein